MSLPEPAAPGKPISRWGLYIPLGLLALFVVGLSAGWLWMRGQALAQMDNSVAALKRAGFEISWQDRQLGGYPFRLNITLTEVTIRERSGWGLEAPRMEAQAFLHAPTQWLVAAPDGLTFVRPVAGPVRLTGKLIRASLSRLNDKPPNLSFEGVDLTFEPGPGAQPFSLSSAARLEMHLRRGPDDEGGVWLNLKQGRAQLSGLLGRIAGEQPISAEWDGRLSHISAMTGRDWPSSVRAWTAAGGRMSVKRGGLTAGQAVIGVSSGDLGVSADGRVRGTLELSLRQAPRALTALGQSGAIPADRAEAAAVVAAARQGSGEVARAALTFQAGETTLGPVALAPAPRIYTPN